MKRVKQAANRYENRSLCFSGWLILTMTTHSLHERLRICVFDSLHTILIARREYGSTVVMLKIKQYVNQLLQLILTHTIATVEDMHASGCSHRRSANNMTASRKGEQRCDVVQSSLVCLFAVIFCSVGSVLLIVHAANTAALHCWNDENVVFTTFDLQGHFMIQLQCHLFCKASSKSQLFVSAVVKPTGAKFIFHHVARPRDPVPGLMNHAGRARE